MSTPSTERPANELFSHPETHQSHTPSSSEQEQPASTNLFREPVSAPESTPPTA